MLNGKGSLPASFFLLATFPSMERAFLYFSMHGAIENLMSTSGSFQYTYSTRVSMAGPELPSNQENNEKLCKRERLCTEKAILKYFIIMLF
jgi:hypothetical protein